MHINALSFVCYSRTKFGVCHNRSAETKRQYCLRDGLEDFGNGFLQDFDRTDFDGTQQLLQFFPGLPLSFSNQVSGSFLPMIRTKDIRHWLTFWARKTTPGFWKKSWTSVKNSTRMSSPSPAFRPRPTIVDYSPKTYRFGTSRFVIAET